MSTSSNLFEFILKGYERGYNPIKTLENIGFQVYTFSEDNLDLIKYLYKPSVLKPLVNDTGNVILISFCSETNKLILFNDGKILENDEVRLLDNW